ncbi:hypothetical protein MFLAVUS_000055 [Mucor flavus]|uniref:Uncharacterized protein n=1 Tax=Mucor flavus TaxID=439312 RepID=A0ABP9YIM2_9FUNG
MGVCRLIYGNINIEELQNFYTKLPGIQAAYNRLQALDNVNLSVEKQGLIGYGQIVSSACDTIATVYNNFYVENYETLKQEYSELKMPLVNKVVYGYILDEVLKNDTRSDMPEDFITQDVLNSASNLQAFLNNIIQPVRNRVHRLPLSREEENAQPAPTDQTTEQPPAQTGELARPQPAQIRQPRRPRLFSLFPSPSFKWRFIKVDGQNLSTLFPDTRLLKEENEANFAFSTRCFFNSFDFTELKIRSLAELQELPGQKGLFTLMDTPVEFLSQGDEQVRSLTVNEYYYSSGSVN